MNGYKKKITYKFWANDDEWEVVDWRDNYVFIEETRKNGQEDTHMYCEMEYNGSFWGVMDENVSTYDGVDELAAIVAHVTRFGAPCD